MAYQLIGVIASAVSIFGALIKVIAKLNAQQRDFAETRKLAARSDETGRLLLKASIAILDGLRQQGANGKVKEMHETLIAYAVEN
ncbi:MAG: hypothetical protein ACOYI5_06110 [Christensenellales bacterium]